MRNNWKEYCVYRRGCDFYGVRVLWLIEEVVVMMELEFYGWKLFFLVSVVEGYIFWIRG